MSERMSRRAVLSTTGRAAVATLSLGGAAVAGTDTTADAELLRLEGEVYAARNRWRQLWDVWNDAQEKVFAARPPWPQLDRSGIPEYIRDAFDKITFGELETIKEVAPNHPYSVWVREHGAEEKAAHERYRAEHDRIAEDFGEPAADEAQAAQMDRVNELTDALFDTRATSLTGLMVKLRLRGWVPEDDEGILNSIEDDVRAIAGEPPREVADDDDVEGDANG